MEGGHKKSPSSENPGCFKCGHCRVSCPILQEGGYFTSTKKKYKINRHLTCDSCFVIYLATCQKCMGQYVGKSKTPFKIRHSNHKQEVKRKIGGLGHHYGGSGCGYENLRVRIIDQVEIGNLEALAETELYWQHQLRCYIENGGNAHCRRKDFWYIFLNTLVQSFKNYFQLGNSPTVILTIVIQLCALILVCQFFFPLVFLICNSVDNVYVNLDETSPQSYVAVINICVKNRVFCQLDCNPSQVKSNLRLVASLLLHCLLFSSSSPSNIIGPFQMLTSQLILNRSGSNSGFYILWLR